MPRGSPFTLLCRQFANLHAHAVTADLHAHTLASDGSFTPSQLMAFAAQARLLNVAITDHDTFAGYELARESVSQFRGLNLIRGVEITTQYHGQETHLLGYWFAAQPSERLLNLLKSNQAIRRQRFWGWLARLSRERGMRFDSARVDGIIQQSQSLGRPHVATLLVEQGLVPNRAAAFRSYLSGCDDGFRQQLPRIEDVITLIRESGGVASVAHPRDDLDYGDLSRLADAGLAALEATFPMSSLARRCQLRQWAADLGLGITGGSDCHGPERRIGEYGLTADELQRLRQLADCPGRTSCVSNTSQAD